MMCALVYLPIEHISMERLVKKAHASKTRAVLALRE